jgi:hypothetical protein
MADSHILDFGLGIHPIWDLGFRISDLKGKGLKAWGMGHGAQNIEQPVSAILLSDTSYETTPKRHGFLMIKLAALQASGGADT